MSSTNSTISTPLFIGKLTFSFKIISTQNRFTLFHIDLAVTNKYQICLSHMAD